MATWVLQIMAQPSRPLLLQAQRLQVASRTINLGLVALEVSARMGRAALVVIRLPVHLLVQVPLPQASRLLLVIHRLHQCLVRPAPGLVQHHRRSLQPVLRLPQHRLLTRRLLLATSHQLRPVIRRPRQITRRPHRLMALQLRLAIPLRRQLSVQLRRLRRPRLFTARPVRCTARQVQCMAVVATSSRQPLPAILPHRLLIVLPAPLHQLARNIRRPRQSTMLVHEVLRLIGISHQHLLSTRLIPQFIRLRPQRRTRTEYSLYYHTTLSVKTEHTCRTKDECGSFD